MTVLADKGGEYASQVFGCNVCNTATTGYYRLVLFLCILGVPYNFGGSSDSG